MAFSDFIFSLYLNGMKPGLTNLKITVKTILQRLILTLQLYGENGLANHAAACAYGFLLSIAPMLLLIVFFIFLVFKPSPRFIVSLIGNIPFLDVIFDESLLSSDFFSAAKPGISGVISVVSLFWAARILALAMQRGLKIIFPSTKRRNPVVDTLVSLAVEAVVLIFVLTAIVGSRTALRFYRFLDFFHDVSILNIAVSQIGNSFFFVVLLGLVAFFAYLFVPVNSPRKFSAFQGTLFFVIACFCLAMVLGVILDISKYNLLYGTLGNLVILLVNVYFYFIFFFLGAQFAYVIDSFDALLFSKLRQITTKAANENERPGLMYNLFDPAESKLKKYLHYYKKSEIIISQGDAGNEIYYLLKGEVEILLPSSPDTGDSAGVLKGGSFFGEMGYLLSEDRTATVRAKTDVSVFVLPPVLFDAVLQHDKSLDRDIIEHITRRLKNANEQIVSLKSEALPYE